jgi:hypothetical protein
MKQTNERSLVFGESLSDVRACHQHNYTFFAEIKARRFAVFVRLFVSLRPSSHFASAVTKRIPAKTGAGFCTESRRSNIFVVNIERPTKTSAIYEA